MIGPGVELYRIRRQLDLYRGSLAELDKPLRRDYPIFREVLVAPTPGEARDAARKWLQTKYEAYFQWGYVDTTFDEVMRDAFIVGDPDGVRAQFERYRDELGITHMLARVQWPGVSQEIALRGLRLLGEQVIPKLRG